MICVIDIENGEVTGWLIGTDTHDIRRQIESINLSADYRLAQLAVELYRYEFPAAGKYQLESGHLMLVSE